MILKDLTEKEVRQIGFNRIFPYKMFTILSTMFIITVLIAAIFNNTIAAIIISVSYLIYFMLNYIIADKKSKLFLIKTKQENEN